MTLERETLQIVKAENGFVIIANDKFYIASDEEQVKTLVNETVTPDVLKRLAEPKNITPLIVSPSVSENVT